MTLPYVFSMSNNDNSTVFFRLYIQSIRFPRDQSNASRAKGS